MGMYEKGLLFIERNKYVRGRNKGDAPCDDRRKTWFRMYKDDRGIGVLFHNTEILRVTPDNRLFLTCAGYEASRTTRDAVWHAARHIFGVPLGLGSINHNGYSQTGVYFNGKLVSRIAGDDGLEFNEDGLVSAPRPFKKYVADREKNKRFREQGKTFRDLLPVLHDAAVRNGDGHKLWASANRVSHLVWACEAAFDPENFRDLLHAFWSDTPQGVWRNLQAHFSKAHQLVVNV